MFGKKILSLVSLLLGSQILKFAEAACTFTYDTNSPTACDISADCVANNYYITYLQSGTTYSTTSNGNAKKIIKINTVNGSSSTCEEITSKGYFTSEDSFITNNANGIDDVSPEASCNTNAGKLASITEAGPDARKKKRGDPETKLCLDDSDENAVGFDEDGSYLVDDNTEFGESAKIIAKVGNNAIRSIAIVQGKSYLAKDTAGLIESGKTLIIKNTGAAIVKDDDLMAWTRNYCVDDNMVVWERKAGLCGGVQEGECTYYNCETGDCIKNDENLLATAEKRNGDCDLANPNEACGDGSYYLITNGDNKKVAIKNVGGAGPFDLIQCTISGQTTTCDTPGSIPTGYLANAGRGDDGTAYYIQCISDVCTPVADVDTRLSSVNDAGKHMIVLSSELLGVTGAKISNYVVVTKKDSNYLIETSGNGYYTTTGTLVQNSATGDLYNCADKTGYTECEKIDSEIPIGYLVNGGDSGTTPYIKCTVAGACQAYAPVEECTGNDDSNYGELFDNKAGTISLCKVKNNGVELILDGASQVTGEFFASVATGKSLFEIVVKDGYNVVLNFADGNIVVDNDPIRYRYTLSGETKIHDRETAVNENGAGAICETDRNGANAFEYILANWNGAKQDLSENVAYYVDQTYEED